MLQQKFLINNEYSLPDVLGRYVFDCALAPLTWFQTGGSASVLFKPFDVNDLANFLKNIPENTDYFVMGAGSNVLVRDGGYKGIVIKLGRNFSQINLEGDLLIAGGAALDRSVAMTALSYSLKGFEFLVTIPGSVGGAVAMNAGCYGFEIKDILAWVEIIDSNGNLMRLDSTQITMKYRKGNLPKGCVVTKAAFYAEKGDSVEIQQKIQEYLKLREESQPTKCKTGGSTFKNPVNCKAWEAIDKAGCRGLAVGGAKISEKHCNFMINTGGALAADLENLGEFVRKKVKENSGNDLEWEIIILGQK